MGAVREARRSVRSRGARQSPRHSACRPGPGRDAPGDAPRRARIVLERPRAPGHARPRASPRLRSPRRFSLLPWFWGDYHREHGDVALFFTNHLVGFGATAFLLLVAGRREPRARLLGLYCLLSATNASQLMLPAFLLDMPPPEMFCGVPPRTPRADAALLPSPRPLVPLRPGRTVGLRPRVPADLSPDPARRLRPPHGPRERGDRLRARDRVRGRDRALAGGRRRGACLVRPRCVRSRPEPAGARGGGRRGRTRTHCAGRRGEADRDLQRRIPDAHGSGGGLQRRRGVPAGGLGVELRSVPAHRRKGAPAFPRAPPPLVLGARGARLPPARGGAGVPEGSRPPGSARGDRHSGGRRARAARGRRSRAGGGARSSRTRSRSRSSRRPASSSWRRSAVDRSCGASTSGRTRRPWTSGMCWPPRPRGWCGRRRPGPSTGRSSARSGAGADRPPRSWPQPVPVGTTRRSARRRPDRTPPAEVGDRPHARSAASRHPGDASSFFQLLPEPEAAWVTEADADAIAPVPGPGGQLAGVLLVGPRFDGRPVRGGRPPLS